MKSDLYEIYAAVPIAVLALAGIIVGLVVLIRAFKKRG